MSGALSEHIDYLSLHGRHELFARAIAKVVKPGDVVADLGCGFGVLGIMCLKAGAARVYGVDSSDAIEIARETMQREGLADRYTCIRGTTYQTQLPEPVDVVICDHVGWFGIDYGMIEMQRDAAARMLKPGGTVMPRTIRLMVAATSSDKAHAKAEAFTYHPVPREYHWLAEYGRNTKHAYTFEAAELASEAMQLGEIALHENTAEEFSFTAKLTADAPHQMQGIAGWFECELAPGVWMTNSPVKDGAIARCQVFLPCRKPIAMQAGQEAEVTLRFRYDSPVLSWSVRGPDGRVQKMSTFKGTVLTQADLTTQQAGALALNTHGQARVAVLSLVDGKRSNAEIEELVIKAHPQLFPTQVETRRFVKAVLGQDTQCL